MQALATTYQSCPAVVSEFAEPVRFRVAWLGFLLSSAARDSGLAGIARFFSFSPRLFVALFIHVLGLLAASFFFSRRTAGRGECERAFPPAVEHLDPQCDHYFRIVCGL